MNIFFLDRNPKKCAEYHADKHVLKMIIEENQLLSTCHHILNPDNGKPIYKPTHVNHPSNIWVRKSSKHYEWLYSLMLNLLDEYTYRYGKIHASSRLVDELRFPPDNLSNNGWEDPPLAMPDEYKVNGDTIASYQKYYKFGKSHLHSWKKRDVPYFIKE